MNFSLKSFIDKWDSANRLQQIIQYIEVEGEKDRKGVCWFASLRLVTKAWENSRQHDLSSPLTAASPSFTPGSRRFMRDERRMHHLTGCASDSLWLAFAAFRQAFNQSSNGDVTLTLSRCREETALGGGCFFAYLQNADLQSQLFGAEQRWSNMVKFCHWGGGLISCNPLCVF